MMGFSANLATAGHSVKLVSASDEAAQTQLASLDGRLQEFYNSQASQTYYEQAAETNVVWRDGDPKQVVKRIAKSTDRVVDFGCGSGHALRELEPLGVSYLGLDWSTSQIEQNRETFNNRGEFLCASLYESGIPSSSVDLAFSFYVLEHLVWPHRMLLEMARVLKPGGHLVIICPEFRRLGRLPSFDYGQVVAPLRAKVTQGHLVDAFRHLWARQIVYPSIMAQARWQSLPWLINLEPTCLRGPYYTDNDAVYLVDAREIVALLSGHGLHNVTQKWGIADSGGCCALVFQKT